MPTLVCPHCGGTSFCGGFRRKGVLITQPTCPTCVVRSGLSVEDPHHRVVCSVCNGTGVVQPPKAGPGQHSLLRWVVALSLLLIALSLTFLSVVYLVRDLRQPEEIREGVWKTVQLRPRTMSVSEIKASVPVGVSATAVRALLGDPDRRHQAESGVSTIEIWYYGAADGEVQITLQDDKVTGVRG
jgi:hypothetical protein